MPPRSELTALHLRVLAFLLLHPGAQGSDLLAEIPGLKSGTLYPLLRQLAERGLLLAEVQAFGSRRTTYTVTVQGQQAFTEAAQSLLAALAPALDTLTTSALSGPPGPSGPADPLS